jgi:hypothetical protein
LPQITKGGKYIFGWSIVGPDGFIPIPKEAVEEYEIHENEKVIIVSGSKATEGLAVIKVHKLNQSEISSVLADNKQLASFQITEGELLKYKGRKYGWVTIKINAFNTGLQWIDRGAANNR